MKIFERKVLKRLLEISGENENEDVKMKCEGDELKPIKEER
jgi:hypothetical protein